MQQARQRWSSIAKESLRASTDMMYMHVSPDVPCQSDQCDPLPPDCSLLSGENMGQIYEKASIGSAASIPSIVVEDNSDSEEKTKNPDTETCEESKLTRETSPGARKEARSYSLFAQVRNQIRAQVSRERRSSSPGNTILEVVQKVTQSEHDPRKAKDTDIISDGREAGNELCQNYNDTLPVTLAEVRAIVQAEITTLKSEMMLHIDAVRDRILAELNTLHKEVLSSSYHLKQNLKNDSPDNTEKRQWQSTVKKACQTEGLTTKKAPGLEKQFKSVSVPSLTPPKKNRILFRTMTNISSKSQFNETPSPRSNSEPLKLSKAKPPPLDTPCMPPQIDIRKRAGWSVGIHQEYQLTGDRYKKAGLKNETPQPHLMGAKLKPR